MAASFLSLDLPDVSEAKTKATIKEQTVKITTSSGELNVFYLEGIPGPDALETPDRKPPVLLLHGMRFTSDTWRQLETIQILSALGYRVIAIDQPGYGKTGGTLLKGAEAASFVSSFIGATSCESPIIVSPSMSGCYALPYIFSSPEPKITGYIPVAPVETGNYTREQYSQKEFPVMIVYGENDNVLGAESLANLTGFPNKHVVCFPGAGHPCYLDDPGLWHKALYNFLKTI